MLLFLLTVFQLTLFALNSILCRLALVNYGMDPLTYTAVRNLSAAVMLAILCLVGVIKRKDEEKTQSKSKENFCKGNVWQQAMQESSWLGGACLFAYMLCFSLAYVVIPSATGTLILNTAVQVGMIGWGIYGGLRPDRRQFLGLGIALGGLALLLAPGLSAPPLGRALLMAMSGLAWAGYTLCGRKASSATLATVGNFLRSAVMGVIAAVFALFLEKTPSFPAMLCALSAGALASALGYIMWYKLVPRYSLMGASIIQLAIPIITAILGVIFLAEAITLRLTLCGAIILSGIFLALYAKNKPIG